MGGMMAGMATKKTKARPVKLSPDRNRAKQVSYRFHPTVAKLLVAIIAASGETQVALLERLIRFEARRLGLR